MPPWRGGGVNTRDTGISRTSRRQRSRKGRSRERRYGKMYVLVRFLHAFASRDVVFDREEMWEDVKHSEQREGTIPKAFIPVPWSVWECGPWKYA